MDNIEQLVGKSVGSPTVFAEVFDRYHDQIFTYLARRVGTDKAGDLASEVFTRAFRQRETFDPTLGAVIAWLYGIATRVLSEHRKAEHRHWKRLERVASIEPTGSDDFVAVDLRLDSGAKLERTLKHLSDLSEDQRDALLLVAWEELSYQNAALALNCPIGTVRSRVARARAALHEAEIREVCSSKMEPLANNRQVRVVQDDANLESGSAR